MGAQTTRIGFAPGDRLYWRSKSGRYLAFRKRPEDFSDWLETLIEAERPSDIVMLGDGRPYHRQTLALLRERLARGAEGPTPWIVEHGYLRPGLILVETWGMGGNSQIPAAFLTAGAKPDTATEADGRENQAAIVPGSFALYAALDVGYHLSNLLLGPFLYPQYRPYAVDGPVREYAGWVITALALPRRKRAAAAAAARVTGHAGPVFLFPLQLAGDYQIRDYGTGEDLPKIVGDVIASFARHAPAQALLVIRQHPLDNGLLRWSRRIRDRAEAAGVAQRVVFQDGGSAEPVLARACGMITVNSTMGLEAIRRGLPCHVIGRAIYALPGLNDPRPLADFWSGPEKPDARVVADFVAFLRSRYHVAGSFDGPGARIGAENLARRFAQSPPPVVPPAARILP